jgi:hypothetical protein
MLDEQQNQKPKAAIDLSHLEGAGIAVGKKSLQHAPEKTENEVRFEHLGGRCVLRSPHFTDSDQPANVKPDAPAESEEDDNA